MSKKVVILTSGKRKTAIARAVLKPGSGRIRVNKKPIELIQPFLARQKVFEPLILIDPSLHSKVNIDVTVRGGGVISQAEAARTAIAKALTQYFDDPQIRQKLLDYDRKFLVSDPRQKETKKPGGRGARAKVQKSYR
ncbi:MAG: 30S ribosomal protein S9 [Candidatus Jordarchaeaceae archaeon]